MGTLLTTSEWIMWINSGLLIIVIAVLIFIWSQFQKYSMLYKEKLSEIEVLNVQRSKTEEELVEYKSKCSELSGQVAIMNGRVREMEQTLKKAKKK